MTAVPTITAQTSAFGRLIGPSASVAEVPGVISIINIKFTPICLGIPAVVDATLFLQIKKGKANIQHAGCDEKPRNPLSTGREAAQGSRCCEDRHHAGRE